MKTSIKPYKHILVAIDFIDDFERVIDRALQARDTDCQLSIMHCVDLVSYPDNYAGGLAVELQSQSMTHAEYVIARTLLEKEIEVEKGDVRVIPGSPAKEVKRYAEQEDVDLVVCGSHGKHGLQLLLGSTSSNILHHASYDVLAVMLK